MSSLETKVLGVAEAVEVATAPRSETKPHLKALVVAIATDVRLQTQDRGDFISRLWDLRDEAAAAATYDPTGYAVEGVNDKIETLCAEVMVAREDTPAMTAEMLALPSAAPPTLAEIAEAFLPFGVDTPAVKAAVAPKPPTDLDVRQARIERYKAECGGMTTAEAAVHLGVSVSVIAGYRRHIAAQDGIAPTGRGSSFAKKALTNAARYKAECLGMSISAAAAHLGVSNTAVKGYRRVLAAQGVITLGNNGMRVKAADALLRYKNECLSQGMAPDQAALHLGVGVETIHRYHRTLVARGEATPGPTGSAVNARRAAAAVERYKAECRGMTRKEAAAHLGVTESTIGNYKRAIGEAAASLDPATLAAEREARVDCYKNECLSQGMTIAEAAAHLGVSETSVRKYHRDLVERGDAPQRPHGVRVGQQNLWQRNVGRFATECRDMSCAEAAAHLGVSSATIGRYSKAAGIKLRRSPTAAVKARRQRFLNECVPQGMTRMEAAAHLGVSGEVVSIDCKALGVKLRRAPKAAPRPEAETKRWLEAAPGLADQGLSKSEAARQVGATPAAFSIAVNHHLPELKWKCGNPLNAQDQRFVCSVPKLAIAGKTKAGAAVALGMDLPAFESKLAALAKYLPDIVWADGANGWSVTH